jgi:hypothetical protein
MGQSLGLTIHNHLKSRTNLCWRTEADTLKYKDCIERLNIRQKYWLRFCKALKMFRICGLAACIVRGITYEGDHRIQRCIFLDKAIWGVEMSGKIFVRNISRHKILVFALLVLTLGFVYSVL